MRALSFRMVALSALCLALSAGAAGCSSGGEGCTPDCAGRECGPDPVCGQSCGSCPGGTCQGGACLGCATDADCGPGARCADGGECACLYGACGGACCLPAQATLAASGALLLDGELVSEVTVRVTAEDGSALAGVPIGLTTTTAGVTLEPAEAATLADGRFTFSARSPRVGEAIFQAALLDPAGEIGAPLTVSFEVELSLAVGRVTNTYEQMSVEVIGTIEDAAGPVPGVELGLSTQRPTHDTIVPPSGVSGEDGRFTFLVSAQVGGIVIAYLEVVGLEGAEISESLYSVGGPELTGLVGFPQPGGQPVQARVGLVWIDRPSLEAGVVEARELCSVPLDELQPEEQAPFSLRAPRAPSNLDFYRPDPTSPELPESFEIAAYAPVVYEDVDASEDFSAADRLVGWRQDRDLLLIFTRGELPDPSLVPGIAEGYQFLRWTDDEQTISPLADHLADNDLFIRGADCPAAELRGAVLFERAEEYVHATYLAGMLVDPGLIGNPALWWNDGSYLMLVGQPIELTPDAATAYALPLPDPADVDPTYTDFLVSPGAGLPRVGLLVPFVFVDEDDDGVFTNLDDDPLSGDTVIGLADFPFGYGVPLLEWVEDPLSLALTFALQNANQGYNLVLGPEDVGILAVLDDNTLQLQRGLDRGHDGLCFRIVRRGGGSEQEILTGADLSTRLLAGDQVASATGGFSAQVLPGDRLILCNEIERQGYFDLDRDYPLRAR